MNDTRLDRVQIIGVPITATNMHTFLSVITERLKDMQGEYVCVSNAHTCVMAHDDPSYWEVQASSVASIPDGKPLSVIGRRECPSMGRVTGPDFMREIFLLSSEHGWRHFFYGTDQKCLDALKAALNRDYPTLDIVGMEPSVFRPLSNSEKDDLASRITESGADFAWIAIGAPRQEILMHDLRGMPKALMVGVGGAFNVLAGIVPEAPVWMQNLSLEWLFRLIQEPKRLFRRYAITNTKFMFYALTRAKRKGSSV